MGNKDAKPGDPSLVKTLVIFELNGILLQRSKPDPSTKDVSNIITNPLAKPFLNELSRHNINYAIWSTAPQEATEAEWNFFREQGEKLAKEPLFLWGEPQCVVKGISSEILGKPLVLKLLTTVWKKYPTFNPTNTLIADHSPEKLKKNPNENCLVLYEYKDTSHESFNPLKILHSILDEKSQGHLADIRSLPIVQQWKIPTSRIQMKKQSPGEKTKMLLDLDYRRFFRTPSTEIFPLVLATRTNHLVLGGFPIDILKRVLTYLASKQKKKCSWCGGTCAAERNHNSTEARAVYSMNCGCKTAACELCGSITHNIHQTQTLLSRDQKTPVMLAFAFDNCSCPKCKQPFHIRWKVHPAMRLCVEPSWMWLYILADVICGCTWKCFRCPTKIKKRYVFTKVYCKKGSSKAPPRPRIYAWCGCLRREGGDGGL